MAVRFKDIEEETETIDHIWGDLYEHMTPANYNFLWLFDETEPELYLELERWSSEKRRIFTVSFENLLTNNLVDDHTTSGRGAERFDEADEFNYVFHQLNMLMVPADEEIDESGGALVPTNYAIEFARQLLMQSYGMLQGSFTRASVSTSYEGGIRIEWISPDSSVRAIVPNEESSKGYIYYESGELYGTQELTAGNLIRLLLEIF